MWCGTGKTRTFTMSLFMDNRDVNVIVFPSLGLIHQYVNDYILNQEKIFREHFAHFICMAFCSDNETKLKIKTNSVKYTTKSSTLNTFLKNSCKQLFLVTYQSFNKFIDVMIQNKITIGRLIYDEAHHIVGDQIQDVVFNNPILDDIVEKIEEFDEVQSVESAE